MAMLDPCESVVAWFARMAVNTRRLFMAHVAVLRIGSISDPMFLFVIAGMIKGSGSRVMAHYAVFRYLGAGVAFEAVFHVRFYFVAIEVFPVCYGEVAFCTFKVFVLLMRKDKVFAETFALTFGFAGSFEMAQSTVGLFPGFEMALQTAFFARPAEAVVNIAML